MDKRSRTSAINGKLGGRPKELLHFEALPDENWRPIEGCKYDFVSDHGRVISTCHNNIRIRKQYDNSWGYLYCNIKGPSGHKKDAIHRLVICAFGINQPKYTEVSHLDGNKYNNHISNLIWETHEANTGRRLGHGVEGRKKGKSNMPTDQVIEIRDLYDSGGFTQNELAEIYDVHFRTIFRIVHKLTYKYL